ncbi:hypothetical protein JB92DRAFT_3275787 [Gautieria morchelliformis]|nr:hypothetical protein JB92DRAFT_3275787 [Gautieria morchelliformis]
MDQTADIFGMACTQACGLMSTQFESSVKHMQHGESGGFLSTFSHGSEPARPEEVARDLGTTWQGGSTMSQALPLHGRVLRLDRLYPRGAAVGGVPDGRHQPDHYRGERAHVQTRRLEATFPINVIGAQTNTAYIAAAQLTDSAGPMKTFAEANHNWPELWELISQVDGLGWEKVLCTRVTIRYLEGEQHLSVTIVKPRGVKTSLTNEEIVKKYRALIVYMVGEGEWVAVEKVVHPLTVAPMHKAFSRCWISKQSPSRCTGGQRCKISPHS